VQEAHKRFNREKWAAIYQAEHESVVAYERRLAEEKTAAEAKQRDWRQA
jgi:hypothetical protein